ERLAGEPSAEIEAAATPAPERRRHIPAAVKRAVWERDQGCCAFVGADGKRCGSTFQLELHPKTPFADGGRETASNLSLLCKGHNDLEARRRFGNAWMDDARGRTPATG